jgi:hypothetical protein
MVCIASDTPTGWSLLAEGNKSLGGRGGPNRPGYCTRWASSRRGGTRRRWTHATSSCPRPWPRATPGRRSRRMSNGAHPRSCGTRCCPRTPWMCFGQCWTTSGGERNVMCERNAIREELYIIHTRGSILRNKRKPKSHMIIDLARERKPQGGYSGSVPFSW